jgi:DNA-binding protein HU-beta
MNKAEIAVKMAKTLGISKSQAIKNIDCFINTVKESVREGQKVSFVGFGNFEKVTRKASVRRNPKTGAKINVPSKEVAKFKLSKTFLKVKKAK